MLGRLQTSPSDVTSLLHHINHLNYCFPSLSLYYLPRRAEVMIHKKVTVIFTVSKTRLNHFLKKTECHDFIFLTLF